MGLDGECRNIGWDKILFYVTINILFRRKDLNEWKD